MKSIITSVILACCLIGMFMVQGNDDDVHHNTPYPCNGKKTIGKSCSHPNQCCSDRCDGFKCLCGKENDRCTDDSDCCQDRNYWYCSWPEDNGSKYFKCRRAQL